MFNIFEKNNESKEIWASKPLCFWKEKLQFFYFKATKFLSELEVRRKKQF